MMGDLPLVVRDCIDSLQEHALKNDQIYKVEPLKTRIQHYKRLYNNRERQPDSDELDTPTACSLLKYFYVNYLNDFDNRSGISF
ncbi:unnamed protein product [Ceratitis capitata]|uniref:(Mediterranean fruit fly) hypothetical protein n=1 Tax=Ceratitis capitata TaxID=7213 RepID=A0A811TZJ1_CERCA|nr:unnamed protein product [Ceratitis capitata]